MADPDAPAIGGGKVSRRFALIIAISEYQDSDFQKLIAPGGDAEALASVLKNPDIGGFDDVKVIKNEPAHKVNEEIQGFFSDRGRNDLLLLYFSCEGSPVSEDYDHTPLAQASDSL